jgi:hypothetical protein
VLVEVDQAAVLRRRQIRLCGIRVRGVAHTHRVPHFGSAHGIRWAYLHRKWARS